MCRWFSFENAEQCGGRDVDRDGKQDIVVFLIDNTVGQNAALQVGKRLDADGKTLPAEWGRGSRSRIGFR